MVTQVTFTEPYVVPDTVVTGLAYMEPVAPPLWRIALYAEQTCPIDMKPERVIVRKTLITMDAAWEITQAVFRNAGYCRLLRY